MTLTSLLDLSEQDMKGLRQFVREDTLHVAVHPTWDVFYDTDLPIRSKEDAPLQLFVDKCIDEILDLADSAAAPAASRLSSMITMLLFAKSKTEDYMTAVWRFFDAYEMLREAAFMRSLGEREILTLIVLPKDAPASSKYPLQYLAHLKFLTGDSPSFIAVESQKFNDGYIHNPGKRIKKADKYKSITYTEKLDAIDRLCSALSVTHVRMFGGNIHQCLQSAEESLQLSGRDITISVLPDVSVSAFHLKREALLNYSSKFFPYRIGREKYAQLCTIVESLVEYGANFSNLKAAKGKPFNEQLSAFENYFPLTAALNQLKIIYSYNHPILSASDLDLHNKL